MKVQLNTTDVRYYTLLCGDTFVYSGDVFIKTTLTDDNEYYSVKLDTGLGVTFYDDIIVTPVKLMVVPEE